jgi:hypothetical protein
VTIPGIDYAWQHPGPAAIAAAGYRFACRYLSRDLSKNLTRAEADQLAAHDISVVANWEFAADAALGGYAQGVADAQLALAQATAAGMPSGRPIYFSVDWDVTPAQEAAVTAYLQGAASVLGVGQVGEYAGYYPVRIARDNGTVAWTWQTSGWSGGQWDSRDTIRQTGSATVGGVQVDTNEAMAADYGQWMPGWTPGGSDVLQSDKVTGFDARGNTVGDVLADQSNFRDWWYLAPAQGGGNPPPAGSRAQLLLSGVADIQARVAALQVPVPAVVDVAALAAKLGPLLATGPTADQVAAAVAHHLSTDLAAG